MELLRALLKSFQGEPQLAASRAAERRPGSSEGREDLDFSSDLRLMASEASVAPAAAAEAQSSPPSLVSSDLAGAPQRKPGESAVLPAQGGALAASSATAALPRAKIDASTARTSLTLLDERTAGVVSVTPRAKSDGDPRPLFSPTALPRDAIDPGNRAQGNIPWVASGSISVARTDTGNALHDPTGKRPAVEAMSSPTPPRAMEANSALQTKQNKARDPRSSGGAVIANKAARPLATAGPLLPINAMMTSTANDKPASTALVDPPVASRIGAREAAGRHEGLAPKKDRERSWPISQGRVSAEVSIREERPKVSRERAGSGRDAAHAGAAISASQAGGIRRLETVSNTSQIQETRRLDSLPAGRTDGAEPITARASAVLPATPVSKPGAATYANGAIPEVIGPRAGSIPDGNNPEFLQADRPSAAVDSAALEGRAVQSGGPFLAERPTASQSAASGLPQSAAAGQLALPDLPRGVPPQIVNAIMNAGSGDVTVNVSLDPPELGRVEIGLDIGELGLRATVFSDRPATGDLLRRHSDILIGQLADAGFSEVELAFTDSRGEGYRQTPSYGAEEELSERLGEAVPSSPFEHAHLQCEPVDTLDLRL